MQVVRHHLKLKDLDFRMVLGDVPPLIPDSAPQLRQLNAGIVSAPIDTTEQRPAPLNRHRHHIDTSTGVVVSCKAAFHRRFLLSRKRFTFLVILFIHAHKITKKKQYRYAIFPQKFSFYTFFHYFLESKVHGFQNYCFIFGFAERLRVGDGTSGMGELCSGMDTNDGERFPVHMMRDIRNMKPAWKEICGRNFALTSRMVRQPNGGTREIPCYSLTKTECLHEQGKRFPVHMEKNIKIQIWIDIPNGSTTQRRNSPNYHTRRRKPQRFFLFCFATILKGIGGFVAK